VRALVVPRLRSILFDLAVAGAVGAISVLWTVTRNAQVPSQAPGYVMVVALLFRRRWPLPTMAVVAAAALGQVLFVRPRIEPMPYDAAVLVAMYSVVKYAPRMLDAWLATAVTAIGIVIEVVHRGGSNWWMDAMFYVAICGGVWATGYTVRTRRIYVAGLEERAATLEREREHLARIAVAEERAAIARELHDVVAHSLAVMIVQADGGRYAFDGDPGRARAALVTVADTGREALEDMRRLVQVLRGTGARGTGDGVLGDRGRATVEHLDTLVDRARSAGLSVTVDRDGTPPVLAAAVELTVYRIAQEALTNVLRHAGPDAKVTLTIGYRPDELTLSIVDDGGDLAPGGAGGGAVTGGVGGGSTGGAAAVEGGNGLVGMRERVAVLGGYFAAGPRLDGGWSVEMAIPLDET